MRLVVLIIGVVLMWAPACYGLWPLTLVAAALTTFTLIRVFSFYRSIPFLLLLLECLSFFLAGSADSPSAEFDVPRGAGFAAISLGVSLLAAIACAEILVVYRGGKRLAAYRMMLGLLIAPVFPTKNPLKGALNRIKNSFRALQIVQGGSVVHSEPPSEDFHMLGPGTLVIRSGNAVVLEKGGKITRIVGPGFYLTEPFEHISAIVDLSLQSENWTLKDVLTKDSIPLEVAFTVQYRVMINQPALIKKAEYRLEEDAIRRAVLTTSGWREQTQTIANAILRDTIAARSLDEIYDPRNERFSSGSTPRVPLQDELRRRLSRESQRWGVEIVRVTLDKITLPEEVKHRMIEAWDVNWHEVVEIARAVTEARAITARARGEGEAGYLKAVQAARARLEAAGIDHLTRLLEARSGAEAELETAQIQREVAEAKAQRTMIEAKAKADARMLEGRAEAVAEAERFRQLFLALQQEFLLDEQMLRQIIVEICKILTSASEFQGMLRFISTQRPQLPMKGEEPHIIGGLGESKSNT